MAEEFTLVARILKKDAKDPPSGWINYRHTNVCIDIRCECGEISHYDGFFLFYVTCPYCQRVYAVGQTVSLYPLSPDDIMEATKTTGLQLAEPDSDPKSL